MATLAIESSTHQPSVCVAVSDKKICELPVSTDGGPGKYLIPAIDTALKEMAIECMQIDLIALAIGPGSFTGLRVGVTTAKSLAYAIGCQVVAFNSLDVVAFQAQDWLQKTKKTSENELHVVMDAQRRQFFSAKFDLHVQFEKWPETQISILDQSVWINDLDSMQLVSGPGLEKIQDKLLHPSPSEIKFRNSVLPDQLWQPRAKTLVEMAAQTKRRDDFWKLVPNYYRLSAAEEKRNNLQSGKPTIK